MVSPINPVPPMAAVRPAPRMAAGRDESRPEGEARRVPARQGTLATAINMQDDLSAAVSSLRGRRLEERGAEKSGQAWVEHILDPDAEGKSTDLRQALLRGTLPVNQLLQHLHGLLPDSSDAVALLRALLCDDALLELRAELQEQLESLLATLADAGGMRSMRAGLNVALKAKLGAKLGLLSPADLRACYRQFIGSSLSVLDQYELWIELHGFENRFTLINFMEQALTADIYALDPSCSRIEFGRLLQVMRRLTTLRSADAILLQHCWVSPLVERLGVSQVALLTGLTTVVRCGGGWPELFSGALSGARYGLTITEKSLLAQGLRRALRALPHELWSTPEAQIEAQDGLELLVAQAMSVESWAAPTAMKVRV